MKLDERDHITLALWAADCAEHVLPYFEKHYPADNRPRQAVEAVRAWGRGEIRVGEARAASVAAHAAAREAAPPAARAAARAAGQAAAVAHMVGHARHAAAYALKASTAAASSTDADTAAVQEREWQHQKLPEHLRSIVFPAVG